MGITTILAIIGAIGQIIQDTPQAIAAFDAIKTMLTNGTEPTQAQWDALDAALKSDHTALQAS